MKGVCKWWILGCIAWICWGCQKNAEPFPTEGMGSPTVLLPSLPSTPFSYSELSYPEHWLNDPALQLFSTGGSISDAGATLGRVLFYDPTLSADGTVSCGSCHIQSKAFGDETSRSIGISGQPTHRNAMPLFNMRYQRRMFWDGRTVGLNNQVLEPIEHPDEMGMDLDDLVVKLEQLPHYHSLFFEAFGDSSVTSDRIASALSQFIRSIQSHQSRYDQGLSSDFSNFTTLELMGKDLFFNNETRCNQCHSGLNFFGTQFFINGLELDYAAAGDAGRGALTGMPEDDGRFRSVSLRNVALTSPYMHDGRFATLHEVVDFYDQEIQPHPFLDERLTEAGFGPPGQNPYQLELTETEKDALVAFLETLTDTVVFDAWWLSNPFP